MEALSRGLDRCVAGFLAAASWLALPVVLLLFLQWPLRDLAGALSREANDLGQWLFALLVAASVTAATRSRVHLAADGYAHRFSRRTRHRLEFAGIVFVQVPWAVFVALASRPQVLASLRQREAFADTLNPGYFIIKLALWVLAGLMLAQAVLDLTRVARRLRATQNDDGVEA